MNACCIAVDLGGSQLRVAKVEQGGKIHWQRTVSTINEGQPPQVIDQIQALVNSQPGADICGLAVAAPGPLDTRNGTVLCIPTLTGWENVALVSMLEERFKRPVLLENDAISGAVGQWRFGVGKDTRDMVYLTVSTGIGGGVISSGRVVRGTRGAAGHFGHLLLHPDSTVRCLCGRMGCFEAYASGSALDAIAQTVHSVGNENERAQWISIVGDELASAAHLAQAAMDGHEPAKLIWRQQGMYLAQGIASIVHAFDPECVVLGGSVSKSYSCFADSLLEELERRLMPAFSNVSIKQASDIESAGLLGVAYLLFEHQGYS